MRKRIFSGIQPSGNLHIGNYLGAIKNWVALQDTYDSIFCVVDLHAITVPQDPKELRRRTLEVAKIYLAAGIDPKKCALFIQSHVQEHAELAWILNTIAKIPELEKMTQFKDKSAKNEKESVSVGLFDYPVLMAADILLYDTELVPVGKDQKQHVELTRTLAERFNHRFGETFIVPKAYTTEVSENIMGLDDPSKKMSKSAKSEYNYISLTDDAETVRKKIKKAVTDSGSEIVYASDKPALKNLINIYSLLSEKSPAEIEKIYVGKGYADFKTGLAETIIAFLEPFQEKMAELTDEKVLEILRAGAEKVRPLAKKKLDEAKEKVGFIL
ncbi:MAG: tryptophan--tRNA ligase [Parcubacteria group bacterium]